MVDFVGSLQLFDGVWIEMEHGPTTWSRLGDLSRAADIWGMSSLVRARDNDPTLISLVLGEGIDGVIVPHVNSAEAAQQAVDAAFFDPIGHRGVGGGRKSYGPAAYLKEAHHETLLVLMIEEDEPNANLAAVLRTPHIDV